MTGRRLSRAAALAAAGAVVASMLGVGPPRADAAAAAPPRASSISDQTPRRIERPLAFEENLGQTDSRARFLVRARGMTAFLCPTETVLALHSSERGEARDADPAAGARLWTEAVRMRFAGANEAPSIEGGEPLPGRRNYLIGNDRSRWVTGVPACARVTARGVWPGIDVVWRGEDGRLTYDFVLAPGADVTAVSLQLEGGRGSRVETDGSLRVETSRGELRHSAPIAYQVVDGERRRVDAGFCPAADGRVGFTVGAHDRDHTLVIDPGLLYSTYLGGTDSGARPGEIGWGVAVDPGGAAYVGGQTPSTDFPTQAAFQTAQLATLSGFVAKTDASGSALVWSTFLGGSGGTGSRVRAIAVDASGAAYLTGVTSNSDFPTKSPLQKSYGGSGDAFVAKLEPSGAALAWSTWIGGSGADAGHAIALDGSNAAVVAGVTQSPNFPTRQPVQAAHAGGGSDAFVLKVRSTGTSLSWATYLGGSGSESAYGVAVNSYGSAWICGETLSTDFPVRSALQPQHGGGADAFLARLDASGTLLGWSTFLGGTADDTARDVAIGYDNSAYVAGTTAPGAAGYDASADFPVVAAFQGVRAGLTDAFVAKVESGGANLVYSTYLGGAAGSDGAAAIAVDSSGAATVVGSTSSADFPTALPAQLSYGGGGDAFVARLERSGAALVISTWFGGSGREHATALALDWAGAAYVTGTTTSADLPLRAPLQAAYGGGVGDSFLANYRLDPGSGTGPLPSAPTELVLVYGPGPGVTLSWKDTSADESGFQLLQFVSSDPAPHTTSVTLGSDATSYYHIPSYPYWSATYLVRSFNGNGSSKWSNEARLVHTGEVLVSPLPGAPSDLRADVREDGALGLSWTDNSAGELGCIVERAEGAPWFRRLSFTPAEAVAYVDDTARPGWPCSYRVASFSPNGPTHFSNVATATVPATLDVAVKSGRILDFGRVRHDRIQVSASWAFVDGSAGAVFDPVADGLAIQLGFAKAPMPVSIGPGDPRWKLTTRTPRSGGQARLVKARWSTTEPGDYDAPTRVTVTVDLVRRRVTVKASNVELGRVGKDVPPVVLRLASGAAGGANSARWTRQNDRLFQYRAK